MLVRVTMSRQSRSSSRCAPRTPIEKIAAEVLIHYFGTIVKFMSVFLVIFTPVLLALFPLWMDRLERRVLDFGNETNETGISKPLPTTTKSAS